MLFRGNSVEETRADAGRIGRYDRSKRFDDHFEERFEDNSENDVARVWDGGTINFKQQTWRTHNKILHARSVRATRWSADLRRRIPEGFV